MKSRLDRIEDWDRLLREAGWQAKTLARNCGIGTWELRHYVQLRFGARLHAWILRRRMAQAPPLFTQGLSVKEIGIALGYRHPCNFSRQFKKFYRISPSKFSPPGLGPGGFGHQGISKSDLSHQNDYDI